MFGMYDNDELIGVITYGTPPSKTLLKGIAGEEYMDKVIELNRLVLKHNRKNEASYLIGKSFKLLPRPKVIVSYADTSQKHVGKVYQATNFIYTGLSAKRSDWRMVGSDMHSYTICQKWDSKHRNANPDKFYKIDRPRKHRYLYFLGDKKEKKKFLNALKYPVEDYPKENNG
tara:strand:+ start:3397 stop:3912 length:516 start_codon:yes stop_codon:yes gene_type:complete